MFNNVVFTFLAGNYNYSVKMVFATCCAMLLIVLPCHVMSRTVFTHRHLYDTTCDVNKANVKTFSRRHINALHLCILVCVSREDCWLAAYRMRTQNYSLLNGTCLGLTKYSQWLLWVLSDSDTYNRDLLAAYPSNCPE